MLLLVLSAQGVKQVGAGRGRWWQPSRAGCKVSVADEAYGMAVGRVTQLDYARIRIFTLQPLASQLQFEVRKTSPLFFVPSLLACDLGTSW